MVNATPRPLYLPERNPVPVLQKAGWDTGPVWTGAENLVSTGIRSPDRSARSESLYRRTLRECTAAKAASQTETPPGTSPKSEPGL